MSETYPVTEFGFSEESEGFKEKERSYSTSKNTVAVVGNKADGTYTYALYQWDLTDAEYVGGGYWSCCEIGGTYGEYSSAKADAEQAISCYK